MLITIKKKRVTRSGAQGNEETGTGDDSKENLSPLLTTIISSVAVVMDERNKKHQIEHEKLKKHYQENVFNQRLILDRYDNYSRQDHVILLGHKEPDTNYEPYGKETQEDFENILLNIGQKVGIDIKSEHISLAHRLGNNHKDSDNNKKFRADGTTPISRPLLFKISK